MTSQYHGGWVTESHGVGATPNQASTVLANPNRTPEKIDIFHTSDATTYEHAVGRKNTDRKNGWNHRARWTSSASPRDRANVVGTMNAAKTTKVSMLERNAGSDSMSA